MAKFKNSRIEDAMERYSDSIQNHPMVIQHKGYEVNLPCPVCEDGKKDHFNFNTIKKTAHCFKCNVTYTAKELAEQLGYEPEKSNRPKRKNINDPIWVYPNVKGNPIFGVGRFEVNGKKIYTQHVFNNVTNSWERLDKKHENYTELSEKFEVLKKELFNILEVKPAQAIIISEGEKCATMVSEILPNDNYWASTTIQGGANGKWHDHYKNELIGKTVYIIPDNDEVGRRHAQRLYDTISKFADCIVIEIPILEEGEDVADWIESGKTWTDLQELLLNGDIPKWLKIEEIKYSFDDIGKAAFFNVCFGGEIKYSLQLGFSVFKNGYWFHNAELLVKQLIAQHGKNMRLKAERLEKIIAGNKKIPQELASANLTTINFLKSFSSLRNMKIILDIIKSDKEILIPNAEEVFDQNHTVINLKNGTYDMGKHRFKKHDKNDFLSHCMTYEYDPTAKCPKFENFLKTTFENNTDLIEYVKKGMAYSLSGLMKVPMAFYLIGNGKNGKSVLIGLLHKLGGNLACKMRAESLSLKTFSGGIPNDIAELMGKRLVTTTEINENHRLDESLIKDMTGYDTLKARFLHKEFFQFRSLLKVWMFGNHKPTISGTDNGIWRRLKFIPFNVEISEQTDNKNLADELETELSGIFNLVMKSFKTLQEDDFDFKEPEIVKSETSEYREESDSIKYFLDEIEFEIIEDKDKSKYFSDLMESYVAYCKKIGETPKSRAKVSQYLKREFKLESKRSTAGKRKLFGVKFNT